MKSSSSSSAQLGYDSTRRLKARSSFSCCRVQAQPFFCERQGGRAAGALYLQGCGPRPAPGQDSGCLPSRERPHAPVLHTRSQARGRTHLCEADVHKVLHPEDVGGGDVRRPAVLGGPLHAAVRLGLHS